MVNGLATKHGIQAKTVDEKFEMLQNMLLEKLEKFLPQKNKTVTSDDQPFCSEKMKRLKRLKSREYHKNRKSGKWLELNKNYKKEVAKAKKKYYRQIIKDLKTSNVSQWFSKLKRLCSYDKITSTKFVHSCVSNHQFLKSYCM